MYVIYSPSVEQYMFVETSRGQAGAEYKFEWIDDPKEATILDDDSIEKLLVTSRLVRDYAGTVVVAVGWYIFVAKALQEEVESKRIGSVRELILVPHNGTDESSIIKFCVDFTRAESFYE